MPRRASLPRGLVRFYPNNKSKILRLPKIVADQLPDNQAYRLDLDEVGIHLIPVEASQVEQRMPSWAAAASSSEIESEPLAEGAADE